MDDSLVRRPIIYIETHGVVSREVAVGIQEQVRACYDALSGPLPTVVALSLFDTLARWQEYAVQRRAEAGVVTAGDEGFLATHDAWEGIPRLNVCLERLQAHSWLLQKGALHQVVAHSILHGGPEFYRFLVPRTLVERSRTWGIDVQVLQQVLYFVAVAVKSYQAVRLLVEHGFIEDQVALARYQLQSDEDDVALWRMARWEPRARLLYLSAQLKPLLYIQPLLPYAPDLEEAGRSRLEHLPHEEGQRMKSLVQQLSDQHSGDTHQDVTAALALVLETLLGTQPRSTIQAG